LGPIAAKAASCQAQAGADRAALYVKECLAITTATHPPCNAANSCEVIGQHIQYMCARDPHAPVWCQAYKATAVPNPPPPMPRTAQPGFDCAKASSPVDREICAPGNDDLAKDDSRMTKLYSHALAQSQDPARLRAGQLAFLRDREQCGAREPGRKSSDIALDHCIAVLTHYRIDALQRLEQGDSAWSTDGPPPLCDTSFGDDGWDGIAVGPAAGTVSFVWSDMRTWVLKPTDKVDFDVDGTVFPGRIKADSDGQSDAFAASRQLIAAMVHGDLLRVKRNGKVIFRAELAGFPRPYARSLSCAGLTK
jgi:uncharacterized protein YecT (DUF1311 family)